MGAGGMREEYIYWYDMYIPVHTVFSVFNIYEWLNAHRFTRIVYHIYIFKSCKFQRECSRVSSQLTQELTELAAEHQLNEHDVSIDVEAAGSGSEDGRACKSHIFDGRNLAPVDLKNLYTMI